MTWVAPRARASSRTQSSTGWAAPLPRRLRRRNPLGDPSGRAVDAAALSRPRGDGRLGIPQDLRRRDLALRRPPRDRHLPRGRRSQGVRRDPQGLREPAGTDWRVAPRRRPPLPRAQRASDHRHGLLAAVDPLPPPALVCELGDLRGPWRRGLVLHLPAAVRALTR